MGIKERKEREREEMRKLILNAANEIITTEGFDNLSVRKIANKIEYSPSIIYHYFQDKEDIVNSLMKNSYDKILDTLTSAQISSKDPVEIMRKMAKNYINLTIKTSEEYKNIMLNSSPAILEHTSVLFQGASNKRKAIAMLCKCLKDVYSSMNDNNIELTAQIIWCAMFGLTMRLITETNINEEQRNKLINHHIKCIIDGMILGTPLDSN
ncbi:MAG: TetR/AcrR family transcriptional regulator [Bacillota bacterium]|nr:TetR/AcrR family transcriptional regulator [Bacillota bacterium]